MDLLKLILYAYCLVKAGRYYSKLTENVKTYTIMLIEIRVTVGLQNINVNSGRQTGRQRARREAGRIAALD
jgi:hypothetical protein